MPVSVGVEIKSWSRNCPKKVKARLNILLLGGDVPALNNAFDIVRGLGSGQSVTLFMRGNKPMLNSTKKKNYDVHIGRHCEYLI